jgi:nitrate/nitrite-specific signal transduction histidine kinase
VTLLSLAGALGILLLTLFTLRRIRRQVVLLNNLVAASERIERGEFATPAPDTALPNELGQLSARLTICQPSWIRSTVRSKPPWRKDATFA